MISEQRPGNEKKKKILNFSPLLSVPADGKMKVCEEDLLPMLVKLLSDDDQGVVANAAGTIMNTAVITKGQHKINFVHVCNFFSQSANGEVRNTSTSGIIPY